MMGDSDTDKLYYEGQGWAEVASLRTQLAEANKNAVDISEQVKMLSEELEGEKKKREAVEESLQVAKLCNEILRESNGLVSNRAEAAEANCAALRESFQDLRNRRVECQQEGEEFPVNTEHDKAVNEGVERVWEIVDKIADKLLSQPHPGASIIADMERMRKLIDKTFEMLGRQPDLVLPEGGRGDGELNELMHERAELLREDEHE